ncbi:MAG: CusA/CzcA family heavy metal efflux RND transporter, partial [Candidatus Eisenbacteria bacterium]|nr:CusA/CzcA family heavy metal efflux RND transporter [Candidatus Eisenbacteria bacterium]
MTSFFVFLLRKRWSVLGAGALLAIVGVIAWTRLPVDAFPDVTNIQVMVLTKAPGLSTEECESRITYPIEQQMGGLPRVRLVRSLSRAGLSQVVVVFEDSVDPYFARQVVLERLQEARDALPEGLEPELAPLSTGLGEIFQYTVEGEGLSAMERRTIQDWLIAPQLRTIPGVTEVNSFGGLARQYEVRVHPEKLVEYGLALRDVIDAVQANNANAGAGYILAGWEQYYVVGKGSFASIGDIEAVVLKASDGTPVFLRDVADVGIGAVTRQGAVTRDAKGETVAGMAIMLRGENSKTVVERVKEAVRHIEAGLPEGARIDVFYDRTELIEACLETVMDALLMGAVFVILVLFLFLAELRTALIVVLSLPITFLFTFVLMRPLGISANLMSLGGLAFSVGMVVDASIVIVENIRRHLAEHGARETRRSAVLSALSEVARPVAFSVLIIALVLVPLFTLQGVEGKMFHPLALTLLLALLTSLAVALVLVPPLSEWLLRASAEREFGFVRRFHHGYVRFLDRAIHRPKWTIGIALGVLLAAAGFVPLLGMEFLPTLDEGAIAINVVRLPNASLDGSVVIAQEMEKRLLRFPEVATVVTKTGRAEISEDPMGPEQSDVFVMLRPRDEWRSGRNKQELIEAMQQDLSAIPGLRLSFSQPIALRVNELISGVKSDLAVKVFGPDLDLLKERADEIATVLNGVRGAQDVKVEQISGMSQEIIDLDRQAMARYALNAADVNELLETGVAGREVSTFLEGQQRFPISVRFAEGSRDRVEALQALLVPAPGGERVPLGQIGRIVRTDGPAQVSRENGMRRVVVEANVRGRDLGGFVSEVQRELREIERSLPPGYFVSYGGQFENQQRAMRQLAIVVPIVLLLIAVLLHAALGSIRNSALVILNLPFALIGGVVAAVAFRMHLSVSAAVAFIVLLGIAVQNGVVLLAFFRQLKEAGRSARETVLEGCRLRFKPLFMTALVSFIGHLPMLYATGSGADIQKPLAVVVMGGLVTSTLLTLVVLPAVYYWLETRRPAQAAVPGGGGGGG